MAPLHMNEYGNALTLSLMLAASCMAMARLMAVVRMFSRSPMDMGAQLAVWGPKTTLNSKDSGSSEDDSKMLMLHFLLLSTLFLKPMFAKAIIVIFSAIDKKISISPSSPLSYGISLGISYASSTKLACISKISPQRTLTFVLQVEFEGLYMRN